jgi:hypothetical protein
MEGVAGGRGNANVGRDFSPPKSYPISSIPGSLSFTPLRCLCCYGDHIANFWRVRIMASYPPKVENKKGRAVGDPASISTEE